ncbi:MAG: hypothetical protein H6858_00060 [Rhodospirillales bacterium]|nr:hypothetical protein [Alphaproteobacteria bacterium]MCB9975975.1 hypothetical protein [Rhodospirillales bacterium]
MKASIESRNKDQLAEVLAPHFMSEDTSGKQTDAQQLLDQISHFPEIPDKTSNTKITSIEIVNGKALITQRYEMTSKIDEKNSIKIIAESEDTWVLIEEKWLLKKTVTKSLDQFFNDSIISHQEHK